MYSLFLQKLNKTEESSGMIPLLSTEIVRFDNYYERLSEMSKLLDPLNIQILRGISRTGPRNLLEVSRHTGIPFTTVYHRVRKLEDHIGRIVHLVPTFSKLGLACVVVINNARPGREEQLGAALKVPNYWWSVTCCEGGFTHHSVHCVPIEHLTRFDHYIQQLSRSALADLTKIIRVGDYIPLDLDFEYYNPRERTWRFVWDKWFQKLRRQRVVKRIVDPVGYEHAVDKRDLLIVKELQKNSRKTLTELAPMLGITLQGVKYHYDKLVARGVCDGFWTNLLPYPIEVSAVYDIMIDFPNRDRMNRFFSFLDHMFFFINVTKVLGKNSLILRGFVPETQVSNMFKLLSELTRRKIITSYSVVRLRYETRESQTISYELFNDRSGWTFDYEKCVAQMRKISAS
jgi:DNA-binding Lrp family transcriptional regulator